ncbi:MAG: hypothetical protein GEU79_07165 [Acidimicrobiia bacterium]|nr:hypothetical protein [Acidimicrobiia bacterium]
MTDGLRIDGDIIENTARSLRSRADDLDGIMATNANVGPHMSEAVDEASAAIADGADATATVITVFAKALEETAYTFYGMDQSIGKRMPK